MGSSLITPLLHITLPDDDGEDRHFAPIILALEAMVAINMWHIRRSLKRAEKGLGNAIAPIYASGVVYAEDDHGREDWRDCYEVIKRGKGDCLPSGTRVLRRSAGQADVLASLADLRAGDVIWGDGRWTKVLAQVSTGVKPTLNFALGNGHELRCSPNHRLFRVKYSEAGTAISEVRADEVHAGDLLQTTEATPLGGLVGMQISLNREPVRVLAIDEGGEATCADIETDTGKFWLPESDVLVHNCDNLVAWRTAELRVSGINAEPVIKWQSIPRDVAIALGYPAKIIPPGGLSMVHCAVRWPEEYWTRGPNGEVVEKIEDVSKVLGMGGGYSNKV